MTPVDLDFLPTSEETLDPPPIELPVPPSELRPIDEMLDDGARASALMQCSALFFATGFLVREGDPAVGEGLLARGAALMEAAGASLSDGAERGGTLARRFATARVPPLADLYLAQCREARDAEETTCRLLGDEFHLCEALHDEID